MAAFSKTKQSNRPAKAAKPLKRGKPVKRQSDKGAAFEREFAKRKRELLPNKCFACSVLAPPRLNDAATLHHVLPRSRGGTNDLYNLLPVCDPCHKWAHANPTDAKALGLLR